MSVVSYYVLSLIFLRHKTHCLQQYISSFGRHIWDAATTVDPNDWLLGAAKAVLAWTGLIALD